MIAALLGNHKRLFLLVGLLAALVLVYVAVQGLTGGGPGDADDTAYEPAPSGSDAVAPPAAPPGSAPPANVTARRRRVVRLAIQKEPENLPTLKEAAKDPEWRVRHAAVDGVGRLAEKGDPLFLIRTLRDANEAPEVRAVAAERLGEMRYWDAGPAIIDAMEDPSLLLRARAGAALRRIIVVDLDFRADDSVSRRQERIGKIRELWPWFYEKYGGAGRSGG